MLIKQIQRFCKKLRKPGSDVVSAAVAAASTSRPSLTLTIGSSARPDSVVVHDDQEDEMRAYTPVFLNRSGMDSVHSGLSNATTTQQVAASSTKALSCRTLMINNTTPTATTTTSTTTTTLAAAEMGYAPSRANKSIDISRPPFVPHPHHRLQQHAPARRSMDVIPPPPTRPVQLSRTSGSFPPYTPSPAINIRSTHKNNSSSNLLLASSASSQHPTLFSSSPKAMMTPLPKRFGESATRHTDFCLGTLGCPNGSIGLRIFQNQSCTKPQKGGFTVSTTWTAAATTTTGSSTSVG